jgi:hypothetical protein
METNNTEDRSSVSPPLCGGFPGDRSPSTPAERGANGKRTRRGLSRRTGSVLILVIALLVLMALIGTAFLTTTQTERYTSGQNSVNTQADLLIDGVSNSVAGTISNGLIVGTTTGLSYRPPSQDMPVKSGGTSTYVSNPYNNADSTSLNLWQADRVPTVYDPRLSASTIPTVLIGKPIWNAISWPLLPDASGNYVFSNPLGGTTNTYGAANRSLIVTYPTSTTVNNQVYPGLLFYVPQSNLGAFQFPSPPTSTGLYGMFLTPTGYVFPSSPALTQSQLANYITYAGDASGNGIADSAFYKLPVGMINGITYYAAVRVVDNNSAVNASTAWTMATDPGSPTTVGGPATSGPNFNFFRSGVGLLEMLSTAASTNEITPLNGYRWFGTLPNSGGQVTGLTASPINDSGQSTTANFSYWSLGDAMEEQLARRGANPGYSGPTTHFAWLGQNETSTLAYKGGLVNPYTSPSTLEKCLNVDLFQNGYGTAVPKVPYAPSQVGGDPVANPTVNTAGNWFDDFYNYGNGSFGITGGMPLRPLLVGNNAVSNACPARYGNATLSTVPAFALGTYYNFGDWVKDNKGRSYVCCQANSGQALPIYNSAVGQNQPTQYWTYVPWTNQPIKTSINTANFQQLYLGFAQVMTDSVATQGSGTSLRTTWNPPLAVAPAVPTPLPMFRSPLRSLPTPSIPALTMDQMLKIRAAIAAVNTMDMRDSDDDVTSERIQLTDVNGTPVYDVEVFGAEKEPYISEVFMHVENGHPSGTKGPYMAVKLVNPYRTPITLNNWRFGFIDRTGTTPVMSTTAASIMIPMLTIPPASADGVPGMVILEDLSVNRPMDVDNKLTLNLDTYSASYPHQPQYPTNPTVDVPGLRAAAWQKEMVLLRPRRADGTLSTSLTSSNPYNETSLNSYASADMVPVDQLNFDGLQYPVSSPSSDRFLYRRSSTAVVKIPLTDTINKAWNMIFPGNYAVNTPADPSAQILPSGSASTSHYYFYKGAGGNRLSAIYEDQSDKYLPNLGAPDGGVTLSTDNPPVASNSDGYDLTSDNAPQSTYPTVPIQVNNTFMAGPNPQAITTASGAAPAKPTAAMFPYGGFARNGDMLQIQFAGSYRITLPRPANSPFSNTHGTLVEMNALTTDTAFANDNSLGTTAGTNSATAPLQWSQAPDAAANPYPEQIGRFCPVGLPFSSPGVKNVAATALDFYEPASSTDVTAATNWHYHWARRLFDYFTVQNPSDDYDVNVDPTGEITAETTPAIPAKWMGTGTNPGRWPGITGPTPVANTTNSAPGAVITNPPSYITNDMTAGSSEDGVGNEGLININTAPWPVLATIAWVPPGTHLIKYDLTNDTYSQGGGTAEDNTYIAQAIVNYRNANGPFKSILDLLKVPVFQTETRLFIQTTPPGPAQGSFSPGGIGTNASATTTAGVRYDFHERFLLVNRVSNLITTHSDTYTCYVLLQGWRGVDTTNPTLAVQRRSAFLLDRNGVYLGNSRASTSKVPTD